MTVKISWIDVVNNYDDKGKIVSYSCSVLVSSPDLGDLRFEITVPETGLNSVDAARVQAKKILNRFAVDMARETYQ